MTTFPHALRYWMAASRKLTAVVHRRISSMIQLYYCNKAEVRGIKMPEAGGVTFVQRFGSALNLNVHFHTDWRYPAGLRLQDCPKGKPVPPPSVELREIDHPIPAPLENQSDIFVSVGGDGRQGVTLYELWGRNSQVAPLALDRQVARLLLAREFLVPHLSC